MTPLYTLVSFMSEQRALELAQTAAGGGFSPLSGGPGSGGGARDPDPDATPVAKSDVPEEGQGDE